MRKFDIGDEIYYPNNDNFGIIKDLILNNQHEYLYDVIFKNGSIIIPQDDIVHAIYNEKFNEEPVSTFKASIVLKPILDKKNKPVCIIAIGKNEGKNIPHFHVFDSNNDYIQWRGGTCLMFKDNRYFNHGKHNGVLSSKQLDAIVEKLKSFTIDNRMTYWQFLIKSWNETFGNEILLPDNLEMPEYNNGKIKLYKER